MRLISNVKMHLFTTLALTLLCDPYENDITNLNLCRHIQKTPNVFTFFACIASKPLRVRVSLERQINGALLVFCSIFLPQHPLMRGVLSEVPMKFCYSVTRQM